MVVEQQRRMQELEGKKMKMQEEMAKFQTAGLTNAFAPVNMMPNHTAGQVYTYGANGELIPKPRERDNPSNTTDFN